MAEQSHLVSVDGATVSLLNEGNATPLFEGTASLFVVSIPVEKPPAYASSSSEDKSRPPLPPRSRSTLSAIDGDEQYLVLTISKNNEALLELPISPSSRVMAMPPRSFIMPSTFGSEESAGYFKLQLPDSVEADVQEHFESVLWGLTSFTAAADSGPRHGDAGDASLRNRLVLVDEDSGRVVGTLAEDTKIAADESLGTEEQGEHEKEPVVIESDASGRMTAQLLSQYKPLDNPSNSRTINLANFVSRGIVTGADYVAKGLEQGASKFVESSKPADKPLVFSPRTKTGVEKATQYTSTALAVSGKTIAAIGSAASVVGDRVGKTLGIQSTPGGQEPKGIRGSLNRGLMAVNSVFDAAEEGGKAILESGSSSASKAVGHRYGQEAGTVAHAVGSSVKRCALVYVDVRGVSRKAVLKAAGKSALKAKMEDGRTIVLTDDSAASEKLAVDVKSTDAASTSTLALEKEKA